MDYTKEALSVDSQGDLQNSHPASFPNAHQVENRSQANNTPPVWPQSQITKVEPSTELTASQLSMQTPDVMSDGFIAPGIPRSVQPSHTHNIQQTFQDYLPYTSHLPPQVHDAQQRTLARHSLEVFDRPNVYETMHGRGFPSNMLPADYKAVSSGFLPPITTIPNPVGNPGIGQVTMDSSVSGSQHVQESNTNWTDRNFALFSPLNTDFSPRGFDPNQLVASYQAQQLPSRTDVKLLETQTSVSRTSVEQQAPANFVNNKESEISLNTPHCGTGASDSAECQCEDCVSKGGVQVKHPAQNTNQDRAKADGSLERVRNSSSTLSGSTEANNKALLVGTPSEVNKTNEQVKEALSSDKGVENLSLNIHLEKRKGRKPGSKGSFGCEICGWRFTSLKMLSRHMLLHSASKVFTCTMCNKKFGKKTLLSQHLLYHTDPSITTTVDSSETQVMDEAGILNRLAKKQANRKAKKLEKIITARRGRKPGSTKKLYKCQVCLFTTHARLKLVKHEKTHKKITSKYFKCTSCSYKSKYEDSFKVHAAMHASTKSTSCLVCETVIVKRPSLIEHIMSHTADGSFICKKCGDEYQKLAYFLLHLVKHKEEMVTPTSTKPAVKPSAFDLPTEQQNGDTKQIPSKQTAKVQASSSHHVLMDAAAMENKLLEMTTAASRLFELSRGVSLLDEKAKVMCQLSDISSLATELAAVSANILYSYEHASGKVGFRSQGGGFNVHPMNSSSLEDSQLLSMIDLTAVKQEVSEGLLAAEMGSVGMQIKMNAYGEPETYLEHQEDGAGTFDEEDDIDEVSVKKKRRRVQRSSIKIDPKALQTLRCDQCNLQFRSVQALRRHIRGHDGVRPYSCDKCGQCFRRNDHLKKHQVTHSEDRPFTCDKCPYAAKTEHRLKIHAVSHTEAKDFPCPTCTYSGRTKYELTHHLKRHERRECSQCNYVSHSRVDFKRHMLTHTSYDCSECEYTTKDRKDYGKHVQKHKNKQFLCCELCGYSCDTMKKFKYHKLRHENKTPYQCADCDYKCSSRASFDCHRLKHAGLKPYLCSHCGSSFRKSSHLNQHMLIHKNEKAYKCSQCGYACRTKHNLKEHEMTHSGEKPFACKYCSFSCRRNKALQIHMAKHENTMLMIALPGMQG